MVCDFLDGTNLERTDVTARIFVQVGVGARSESGIPAAGLGLTFLQFRVAAFNQDIAVPY